MAGNVRVALWVIALAIDYGGVVVGRGAGWRLSPGHFAERHGLIVMIALGESIVALGVGATGTTLSAGVITTALVGMTIATAIWWTYFDWVSIVVEYRLRQAIGTAQTTLARDVYSYCHFIMVAGIVVSAMSLKKALAHYDHELAVVPATALCLGLGAYLLAHILIRLRASGTIGHGRPAALAALIVFWPFADDVPGARRALGHRRDLRDPDRLRSGSLSGAACAHQARRRADRGAASRSRVELLVDRLPELDETCGDAPSSSLLPSRCLDPFRIATEARAGLVQQAPALGRQADQERSPVGGVVDSLRVATALEPPDPEDDRRERHVEDLGHPRRSQRAVGADRHVERVVLGRQVDPGQGDLDQTLALLLRPEDLEEDRRWAGGCQFSARLL